jgi:hypothetical protein
MSVVFALSTIVTSAVGLQRVRLSPIERYGEVLSSFISLVGVAFWIWPVL